jgi:hypothetical protein
MPAFSECHNNAKGKYTSATNSVGRFQYSHGPRCVVNIMLL